MRKDGSVVELEVVPTSRIHEVLDECHKLDHRGVDKTWSKVVKFYIVIQFC